MNTIYTISTVLVTLATVLGIWLLIASLNHSKVNRSYVVVMSLLLVVGVFMNIYATQKPRIDRYNGKDVAATYEDIMPEAYNEGYNAGYITAVTDIGIYAEDITYETIENWLRGIRSVIATNDGLVRIIDSNGMEYELYIDGEVPALEEGEEYNRLVEIEDWNPKENSNLVDIEEVG